MRLGSYHVANPSYVKRTTSSKIEQENNINLIKCNKTRVPQL